MKHPLKLTSFALILTLLILIAFYAKGCSFGPQLQQGEIEVLDATNSVERDMDDLNIAYYLIDSAESLYKLSSSDENIDLKNYDEAEQLYHRSIEIIENILGPESIELIAPLKGLTYVYSSQEWIIGKSERSVIRQKRADNYKRLLDVIKVNPNGYSSEYLFIVGDIMSFYSEQEKEVEAEEILLELLKYYESNYEKNSISSLPVLFGLADLYSYSFSNIANNKDKKEQIYEHVAQIFDKNRDNTSHKWLEMLYTMAVHFDISNQAVKSEEVLVRAMEILGGNHIDDMELENNIKKGLDTVRIKNECIKTFWTYGSKCDEVMNIGLPTRIRY